MTINTYIDYEIITKKDDSNVLQIGILKDNIEENIGDLRWHAVGSDVHLEYGDVTEIYKDFPDFMVQQLILNKVLYVFDLDRETILEAHAA